MVFERHYSKSCEVEKSDKLQVDEVIIAHSMSEGMRIWVIRPNTNSCNKGQWQGCNKDVNFDYGDIDLHISQIVPQVNCYNYLGPQSRFTNLVYNWSPWRWCFQRRTRNIPVPSHISKIKHSKARFRRVYERSLGREGDRITVIETANEDCCKGMNDSRSHGQRLGTNLGPGPTD